MPQYLDVQAGMRLKRRPGSLVLSYQDNRVPHNEPLVVTYVSKTGRTVTLWLETQQRAETLFLNEVVAPDFVVIDEHVVNLDYYHTLAAVYRHGTRIAVVPGMRLKRTGRPLGTFDNRVPYNTVLTVTVVEYEEFEPGFPSKDFVLFDSPLGPGNIGSHEMTDAYFELAD